MLKSISHAGFELEDRIQIAVRGDHVDAASSETISGFTYPRAALF